MFRAWALGKLGRLDEGVKTLEQAIAAYRATGAEIGRPHCQGLLAELLGEAGRHEDGLRVLAEAIAFVEANGNDNQEAAELYRLKGDLLIASDGDEREAQKSFETALEIAQTQEAKLLEERVTATLAPLVARLGSGRRTEWKSARSPVFN